MAGFLKELLDRASFQPPAASPERVQGRLEAVGQGLGGFGDEIGAGMQGAMAKAQGGSFGDTYHQALGENRDILARQQEAEPWRTRAIEAISGAAATAPLAAAPALTAVKDIGMAARLGAPALRGGVAHAAKAAAPVGALFGLGKSTATSLPGQALDTLLGGAAGAATAGLLRGGANALLKVPGIQKAVERLHVAALQARLQRMNSQAPYNGPIHEYEYYLPLDKAAAELKRMYGHKYGTPGPGVPATATKAEGARRAVTNPTVATPTRPAEFFSAPTEKVRWPRE